MEGQQSAIDREEGRYGFFQLTHKSVLPLKLIEDPLGSAYPWIVHGPERDVALVIWIPLPVEKRK
jgi:hypothetical protein